MDRDAKLPALDGATRRDRLTALARLELAVQRDPVVTPAAGTTVTRGRARGVDVAPSAVSGCISVDADAGNELALHASGPTTVGLRGDGLLRMWLRDEARNVDGEAVLTGLTPDADQVLSIGDVEGTVVLSLPEGPGSVLCGVG
jgi:hypothetical protein